MTVEKEEFLQEMVKVLEAKRDQHLKSMEEDEKESGAELKKQLEIASVGVAMALKDHFHTDVAENPLLILGVTQLLGAELDQVLRNREGMPVEDVAPLLAARIMGTLEALVHLAVHAAKKE